MLDDLREFNKDRKLNIDAVAFNLYVCMAFISKYVGKDPVEVIIDRTNKPGLRKDIARKLANTDQYFPECGSNIKVNLLDKGSTYKQVVEIQAADFLAWEARKDIREKIMKFYATKPNVDLYSWLEKLSRKNIYYRKSLKA